MVDFRKIHPVGQFDINSCWAACMAWWLKAAGGGRPIMSQGALIAAFDHICAPDGTIPTARFIDTVAARPDFRMSSAVFTGDKMDEMRANGMLPLTNDATLIGFTKRTVTAVGDPWGNVIFDVDIGGHMNAVFGQHMRDDTGYVTAMEPFYPPGAKNGHRTGRFQNNAATFYLAGPELHVFTTV